MAFDILWAEGYDNLANSESDIKSRHEYTDPGSTPFKILTGGPFGGEKFLQDGWGAYWFENVFATIDNGETTVWLAWWMHRPSDAVTGAFVSFVDSNEDRTAGAPGNVHVRIDYDGAGTIEVWRGDGVASLGTAEFVIPQDRWFHVEVKVVLHESAGTVEMRVNEKVAISLSGLDTINDGGLKAIHGFQLVGYTNNGTDVSWSDIVVQGGGGDWLGFHRIKSFLPDSDGAEVDWTATGAATDWETVDDTDVDMDTTYLGSSTSGNRDRLGFVNPSFIGQAAAVVVTAAAKKMDLGQTTYKLGIRGEAGTENLSGPNRVIITDYKTKHHAIINNPEDAAAWESTDLDGAEIVLELV